MNNSAIFIACSSAVKMLELSANRTDFCQFLHTAADVTLDPIFEPLVYSSTEFP